MTLNFVVTAPWKTTCADPFLSSRHNPNVGFPPSNFIKRRPRQQLARQHWHCPKCSNIESRPRPDAFETEPGFLPQTIEYAIQQSQDATKKALCSGVTQLRIELPMGRSRKHWYVLSPMPSWYEEASILAFHYAELFNGLHITIVLGSGPGVEHPVPWISELRRIEDETPPLPPSSSWRIVIFAAISQNQRGLFEKRLKEIGNPDVVILFCSFLDAPLSIPCESFTTCYMCRALDRLAVMKEAHDAFWSVFIEIAVFEYEWVGNKSIESEYDWLPRRKDVERFAFTRGALKIRESEYLRTNYSGCEAGFWPFMTISCRDVLPLDGGLIEQKAKMKQRSKSKPFGFF